MDRIGIRIGVPSDTLPPQLGQHTAPQATESLGSLPNRVVGLAVNVCERAAHRYDVVLRRHTHGGRDGRMQAECLANDHVEIGQSDKFVHGRAFSSDGENFVAQLLLYARGLRECEQAPSRRSAGRLVSGSQKASFNEHVCKNRRGGSLRRELYSSQ